MMEGVGTGEGKGEVRREGPEDKGVARRRSEADGQDAGVRSRRDQRASDGSLAVQARRKGEGKRTAFEAERGRREGKREREKERGREEGSAREGGERRKGDGARWLGRTKGGLALGPKQSRASLTQGVCAGEGGAAPDTMTRREGRREGSGERRRRAGDRQPNVGGGGRGA